MSPEEIKKIESAILKSFKLNDFEKKFINSLYKIRFGQIELSEKQKTVLEKIK